MLRSREIPSNVDFDTCVPLKHLPLKPSTPNENYRLSKSILQCESELETSSQEVSFLLSSSCAANDFSCLFHDVQGNQKEERIGWSRFNLVM